MFPRLQDFIGKWHITRQIAHADGATAQFEGQARFVPSGKELRYDESGTLRLATGQSMHAERAYVWAEGQDCTLEVYFDDGRPFHHIAPGAERAQHWCDPDTYQVYYDFADWPIWSSRWQVNGPRKNYCMTSHYRRGSGAT
ncbi:DUF6314 family protein [Roseovarius phycicola]|uniref:DUF6314 family protein n=1 Tax=Roseovarius phycicola TaxID=3080976 RepID=A0ABZ2HE81_9RHOB